MSLLFEDEEEGNAPRTFAPAEAAERGALLSVLDELNLVHSAWGIDPATTRFAVAGILPRPQPLFTHLIRIQQVKDEAGRLSGAYHTLVSGFRALAAEFGPPLAAVLEQPFAFGRNVHPQSFYFAGIGLAALREACPDAAIFSFGPGQWKKRGLGEGRGTAKKPAILEFARSLGFQEVCPKCGTGEGVKDCKEGSPVHDKADALGMAMAAARLL